MPPRPRTAAGSPAGGHPAELIGALVDATGLDRLDREVAGGARDAGPRGRRLHREPAVPRARTQELECHLAIELRIVGHRRFGAEFDAAFRSAFESMSHRERTLLRYQVIDRLGIDRIAVLYGVHRATAARWVAHAREALVDGVRRTFEARLQIGSAELDSLLRVVHSKLELSLRLLLTPR